MKSTLLPVLTLFSFLITISYARGQSNSQSLVDKLRNYSLKTTEYKLYIHFDKPYYSPTDDIWFKVYLVNARNHKPVDQSIAFVDLLNSEGEIVIQKQIQISNGGGTGDFSLSSLQLSSGNYTVRGYTNYMRNFDSEDLFYKQIEIVSTQSTFNLLQNSDVPEVNMRFFPEGGELLAEYDNILAFKISGNIDKSARLSGIIVDNQNKVITTFETEHDGLGMIKFKPAPDEKYRAILTVNGKDFNFGLPVALSAGYLLNVKNTGRNLIITARHSDSTKMEKAYVLIHQRGDPFAVISSNTDSFIQNRIPVKDLQSGIVTVTLFDENGLPRRERVAFVENPSKEVKSLKLVSDKPTYQTREKVVLGVESDDQINYQMSGSVSVTNLSLVPKEEMKSHLMSYLLLSSDIKGHIYNPAYYFDDKNEDRLKHIDLLMLTQGWRRFRWDQVLKEDLKTIENEKQTGITLSGKIVDFDNRNKPLQGLVKLTVLSNPSDSKSVLSNENGEFSFENLFLNDTVSIVLQAKRYNAKKQTVTKDNNIFIEIDDNEIVNFSLPELPPLQTEMIALDKLIEVSQNIASIDSAFRLEEGVLLLDEFEIQSTKTTTAIDNPFKQAEILYGEPTKRMVVDSMARIVPSGTIFDLLRSTSGILIMGSFPNQVIRIRGFSSANSGMSPLVLLDGVQINPDSSSVLSSVFISDISYVDIIKSPESAIFGSQGANGAIAIYTRTGPGGRRSKRKVGITNLKFPGFSVARQFYTPDYTEKLDRHKQPDYRTTLYWNPDFDMSGISNTEFFTSDEKGTYLIHLEAISEKGEAIVKEKIIEVK